MQITTTRFGNVDIEADDIFLFPNGLIGFESLRHWVLLADADNAAVGWLQSVARSETAMAVVSPLRFVTDYKVRVNRSQLQPLNLQDKDRAFVLSIVSKSPHALTLNLKAPLIVNLDRRLGRQVVTNDEQPLQLAVASTPAGLRKSA